MAQTETLARALLYTHPDCEYSTILKDELIADGTQFDEIDLTVHPERWDEVVQLSGGDRITPVMVARDGSVEIGYHGVG